MNKRSAKRELLHPEQSRVIQMEASMQKSGPTWFSLLTVVPVLATHRERGPDPLALVQDYARRANAHDIPGIMAMFAEDAEFKVVGQGIWPDLVAIQAIHEYDKGINTTMTFYECRAHGLSVTCRGREQNDWLEAAGLGDITYTSLVFAFTVAGRIQRIVATASAEDRAAMSAVLAEFIPWLQARHPESST